jgi:ribulose-phosphate 3-epimerase
MLDSCNREVTLEVDGGVKLDNCAEIARAGAEVLVAGSAIFNTSDPAQAVQDMKTRCRG